jgi:hypothetical protein
MIITPTNLYDSINSVDAKVQQVKDALNDNFEYLVIDKSLFTTAGFIGGNGVSVVTTFYDCYFTDFIPVKEGMKITIGLGGNTQMSVIATYSIATNDSSAVIRKINNVGPSSGKPEEATNVTIEIQEGEHYIRFCSFLSLIEPSYFWKNEIPNLGSLFDYSKVLQMPRQIVRSMVETASNGNCTAIYDDNGYPSLMYKIPIISIGALDSRLGDYDTPHPAFVVNGVTKPAIYIACFMTSLYEGHPVSWFGLSPNHNNNSFATVKGLIKQKGTGWHAETIYEKSLCNYLSMKHNGVRPTCDNYYCRSNVENHEYECSQRTDGMLPGTYRQDGKYFWINGTQPLAWSHNNERYGIFDLIGGHWEWVDLVKISGGQLYIPTDNNFNLEQEDWPSTGAYINMSNNANYLLFDNKFTVTPPTEMRTRNWVDVTCSSDYDTLNESLRKKLCLLHICPRLSSADTEALYNFRGAIWATKDENNCMVGGASAYPESGFGYCLLAYPNTEVHGNMGSRIAFIA